MLDKLKMPGPRTTDETKPLAGDYIIGVGSGMGLFSVVFMNFSIAGFFVGLGVVVLGTFVKSYEEREIG